MDEAEKEERKVCCRRRRPDASEMPKPYAKLGSLPRTYSLQLIAGGWHLTGFSIETSRIGHSCPPIAYLPMRCPKKERGIFHSWFKLLVTHHTPIQASASGECAAMQVREKAHLLVVSHESHSPPSPLSPDHSLKAGMYGLILATASDPYKHSRAQSKSPQLCTLVSTFFAQSISPSGT